MQDRAEQRQHALATRLKLRQLVLLQALAAQRSLSRVAAAQRLSQPALTKALQEIEDIFGARLFERSSRGLRPTPAGEIVLARTAALLADLDSTARELSALEAGRHARLRIGVIPYVPAALLDAALGRLLAPGARVSVLIREGTTDELAGALRAHELDCAIGRSFDAGGGDDLLQEPLYRQSPCLVVPAASRARLARGPLDWQRLAALDWVLPPPNTPIRRTINAIFASAGVLPPVPLVETYALKSIEALLRREAHAIAILPHDIGGELVAAGAAALLPHALHWSLPPIALLRLKDRADRPALQAVAAAIRGAAAGIAPA